PQLNFLVRLYKQPVEDFYLKRDQPRDQILRGRIDDAAGELGTSQDRLQEQLDRFKAVYDPAQIEQWRAAAAAALAPRRDPEAFPGIPREPGRAPGILADAAS